MAKVLLVEDDVNLREIYAARLQAEGYETTTAGDGEEALAIAVKEKPDLIILDVMMPKISGFDVLDILRSTPETKDAKIMMMTALSQDDDKERGQKLGANRYLVKSQVTLEDMVANAKQLLGEDSAAAATTPEPAMPPAPVPAAPVTEPAVPTPAAPEAPSAPAPVAVQPPAIVSDPSSTAPSAPTEPPAEPAPNPSINDQPPAPAPVQEEPTTAAPAPAAEPPAPEEPANPVPTPEPVAPTTPEPPTPVAPQLDTPPSPPTPTAPTVGDTDADSFQPHTPGTVIQPTAPSPNDDQPS